jgi:hypothetical protein
VFNHVIINSVRMLGVSVPWETMPSIGRLLGVAAFVYIGVYAKCVDLLLSFCEILGVVGLK